MLPVASKKTDGRNVPTTSSTNAKHDGESYNSSDEENPDVIAFEQEANRYQSRGEPNGPAKGKQNRRQQQKQPQSNPQTNPQKPLPSNSNATFTPVPPKQPPPSNSNSNATFTPVPPQQPPPPARGVAMQGNRIPAMTAYGPTTAPARGNRRAY